MLFVALMSMAVLSVAVNSGMARRCVPNSCQWCDADVMMSMAGLSIACSMVDCWSALSMALSCQWLELSVLSMAVNGGGYGAELSRVYVVELSSGARSRLSMAVNGGGVSFSDDSLLEYTFASMSRK